MLAILIRAQRTVEDSERKDRVLARGLLREPREQGAFGGGVGSKSSKVENEERRGELTERKDRSDSQRCTNCLSIPGLLLSFITV